MSNSYLPQTLFGTTSSLDIIRGNFTLFMINNALSSDEYNNLRDTFPTDDEIRAVSTEGGYGGSITAGSYADQSAIAELISKRPHWQKFINRCNSDEFVRFFQQTFHEDLMAIEQRFVLGKLRLWTTQDSIIPWKRKTPVTFSFRTTFPGEIGVRPHTDVPRKLVSLLLYFPSDDWKEEFGGGTKFFRQKLEGNLDRWKNWNNRHLTTEEDLKIFFNDMEEFFDTGFKPNQIGGFIKSDTSWHAVDRINCPEGMTRRVFMININSH